MPGPAGFLHDNGTAQREVAGTAAAKPPGQGGDITVFGNAPFPVRIFQKLPVGKMVGDYLLRFHQIPAELTEFFRRASATHPQPHRQAQLGGGERRKP